MTQSSRPDQSVSVNLPGLPAGAADPCVHCGFCLPTCASYRVLASEMDSPRGRIHALRAIEAGELELDANVASHFDTCLGCFACVSACPSGVRYDQLIEHTRPKLIDAGQRSAWGWPSGGCCCRCCPTPTACSPAPTLRPYAGTPLQRLARRSDTRLFGPEIEAMEQLLPPWRRRASTTDCPRSIPPLVNAAAWRCCWAACSAALIPPSAKPQWRCCRPTGLVVIPPDQGCCGAVSHHQGELELTRKLASALVRSFNAIEGDLDAVLVAASGCGHTMKAYGELLRGGDSSFRFPVLDVHEFLAERGLSEHFLRRLQPLEITVAFHDACHMIHGQGIQAQPRELLHNIPDLQLREATEAGVCCGSAGIYNLVQPQEAAELGRIKADDLSSTGADLVASANIGCTLQLRQHLGQRASVQHPMELLAASAGLHPLPGLAQSGGIAEVSGEGEDRQAGMSPS